MSDEKPEEQKQEEVKNEAYKPQAMSFSDVLAFPKTVA